jgi:stage III sporulation protein AG
MRNTGEKPAVGKEVKLMDLKKVLPLIQKHKFVLIIIAAGMLLMLWPAGKSPPPAETAQSPPAVSLAETEERIAASIAKIDGVGRIELVLTVRQDYPGFRGALVVCDGAGDIMVTEQIINAVMSLTGLPSDRITVAKMKQ